MTDGNFVQAKDNIWNILPKHTLITENNIWFSRDKIEIWKKDVGAQSATQNIYEKNQKKFFTNPKIIRNFAADTIFISINKV